MIKKVIVHTIALALAHSMQLAAMDHIPQQEPLFMLKPCIPGQEDPVQHLIREKEALIEALKNAQAIQIPQGPVLPAIFLSNYYNLAMQSLSDFYRRNKISSYLISQDILEETICDVEREKADFLKKYCFIKRLLDHDELSSLYQEFLKWVQNVFEIHFNCVARFHSDLVTSKFGTFQNFWEQDWL